MNDTQLLQSFVQGSESAFRQLVVQHLPLVLGTARRLTGDSGLAEDVAQTVFILLARKASTLRSGTILSGWLYRTTCFVARRALCSEQRRQRREKEAAQMHQQNESDAKWERITPELDAAMGSLGETDRNALLLRFFNDQPLREVGVRLGISEEAAKKRVARALEKLRMVLQRRGKEISVAALAAGLSQESSRAGAHAALATQIAQSAISNAAAGTAALAGLPLLTQVLSAMGWAKVRIVGAGVAGLIAILLLPTLFWQSGSIAQQNSDEPRRSRLAVIQQARENLSPTVSEEELDTKLEIELRPVQITVLDDHSSKAIEGVRVTHVMMPLSKETPPTPLLTDMDGVVKFELPKTRPLGDRMAQFQVWLHADGYAQRQIHWLSTTGNVLSLVSNYTVRMSRGITLAATVIDDAGQPIPKVKVNAYGSNYRGYRTETVDGKVVSLPEVRVEAFASFGCKDVVTDSFGRFELRDYPADLPRLLIELTTAEDVHARFRTPQGKSLAAEQLPEVSFQDLKNGTAQLVISRGLTIEGLVVNSKGQPVEGAKVIEATQWGNLKVLSENTTDAAGRFRLLNRPVREFILSASHDGHASASVVVNARPGMEPVRIELDDEMPLRGRVVDQTGMPQPYASVTCSDYLNEGVGYVWSDKTDTEGRFIWRGAPKKELSYHIGSGAGRRSVRLAPSTNEHVVILQPFGSNARIKGQVVDAESQTLVSDFQVKVSHGMSGDRPDAPVRTIAGTNGAFDFEMAHSDFRVGAHAGWVLQIEAEGYEPALSRMYAFEEGSQDLTFELKRGGEIEGTIFTPLGDPAALAKIALAGINEGVFSRKPGELRPRQGEEIRADTSGAFKLKKEFGATFLVVFHETGWAVVDLSKNPGRLNVQLQPWGRIEGALLTGGVPKPGERVKLAKLIFDIADPIITFRDAVTDEEGRFVFEQLPSANYELSISPPNFKRPDQTLLRALQTPVTVEPGETQYVTLGSTGVTVMGRVHLPPGVNGSAWTNAVAVLSRDVPIPKQPERGQFVSNETHRNARLAFARNPAVLAQLQEARSYAGQVSEHGSLVFEQIPPGRYILEVTLLAARKPNERGDHKVVAHTRVALSVPEERPTDGESVVVSFDDLVLEPF